METSEKKELIDMIQGFNTIDFITPETVPDIDLYMDQITTFMDTHLASCKRYPDDKILTKTMINNYTKNDLIPPPVRKKYSKEHLLLLIFVYYMKDFLSISDIKTLIEPMTEKFFHRTDGGITLHAIYQRICELEEAQINPIIEDLNNNVGTALEAFEHLADEISEKYSPKNKKK